MELENVAESKLVYIISLEESSIQYQNLQSVTHFHRGRNSKALETNEPPKPAVLNRKCVSSSASKVVTVHPFRNASLYQI